MKKILAVALLTLTTLLTVTGCSRSGYGKTEKITDASQLEAMNQTISTAITEYFGIPIPTDKAFEFEAFQSLIPSPENPKEHIHYNNIFQASIGKDDLVEGQIAGYGGVLSADNTEIVGLIVNVYNENVSPKEFTSEELQTIAISFLKDNGLIEETTPIKYVSTNEKASSSYITVMNFDSDTEKFAIGVNLQYGEVIYFEHVPLDLLEEK